MENRHLYRAKDMNTDKWHTGFYTWCEDNSFINVHESHCVEAETNSYENWLVPYNVDPKTIGQCTGLKDKNGVLIFEGDKINIIYTEMKERNSLRNLGKPSELCEYESFFAEYIDIVIFKDGCFAVKEDDMPLIECEFAEQFEIIGNIHDGL